MVLVHKWPCFQICFFRQYRPAKYLLRYSRTKKRHFSKGVNSWFWSKNGYLTNFFFLGNKSQKSIFYDILERRNTFLGYKNKRLKKSKNWYFSKVVNPWFWSKNGHFSNFAFSGKIAQSNVFYDIVERKNAFLSYKNTKLQKSKNWHFFKGVNPWFLSKNGHLTNFVFLGNIAQATVFYGILDQKKTV